ncbi:hypothetical protein LZ637_19620 [Shewanella algae]|nr:hypothetical protein [Shewanella algae]MCE9785602.1 hypothetical protein [Shewanella algae]
MDTQRRGGNATDTGGHLHGAALIVSRQTIKRMADLGDRLGYLVYQTYCKHQWLRQAHGIPLFSAKGPRDCVGHNGFLLFTLALIQPAGTGKALFAVVFMRQQVTAQD